VAVSLGVRYLKVVDHSEEIEEEHVHEHEPEKAIPAQI
jgi:hypothetical protein